MLVFVKVLFQKFSIHGKFPLLVLNDNYSFNKKGKEIADAEVAKALYRRALGYEHPDVHITNYQGEITETEIIKYYPPDTAAAFIWLKNRSGWRDKQEVEHSGGVNMIYDPVLDGPIPDDTA